MQNLCSEVRQPHCLVIRQRLNNPRIRYPSWICAEDAVDVGPDVDFISIEQIAENRAGEITPVPPKGGLQAVNIACDEPGDDERFRRLSKSRRVRP